MREAAVHHRHRNSSLVDLMWIQFEYVVLEEDQVGLFAHFEAADLAFHARLPGRGDRDPLDRIDRESQLWQVTSSSEGPSKPYC